MQENLFNKAFESSMKGNGLKMTGDESERFKKAFDDPEFRKMFSEYMDELQDPANREETEAYIRQLEGEEKVPEGKELVRPTPGFVVKTKKFAAGGGNSKGAAEADNDTGKGEKIFINIVQSSLVTTPSQTKAKEGVHWSLPYSVGPPHMEKDNNDSSVVCFDCCFHPEALVLGNSMKQFKDLLVKTAIEGVTMAFKRQQQEVTLDADNFHILKGVQYKSGTVPTMLVDSTHKKTEWGKAGGDTDKTTGAGSSITISSGNNVAPISSSKSSSTTEGEVKQTSKLPPPPPTQENHKSSSSTISSKSSSSGCNGASSGFKKGFLGEGKSILSERDSGSARKGRSSANGKIVELDESATHNRVPSANTAKTVAVSSKAFSDTRNGLDGLMKPSKTVYTVDKAAASLHSLEGATKEGDEAIKSVPPVSPSSSSYPVLSVPSFTVTERGVVSMGDFEALKSKVVSNRPAELVYRIALPLIKKASLTDLDIGEREMKLRYPAVYELNVTLPYPVFNKKGTAKFDSSTKTLTVTIPVQPPKPNSDEGRISAVSEVSAVSSAVDGGDVRNSNGSDASNNAQQNESGIRNGNGIREKISSSQSHARWVAGTGADAGDAEAQARSESLKREIAQQAAEAVREAQQAHARSTESAVTQAATKNLKTDSTVATNATNSGPDSIEFKPNFFQSKCFTGTRVGYVFKTGSFGTGYYLDCQSSSDTAVSSTPQLPPETAKSVPAALNTAYSTAAFSTTRQVRDVKPFAFQFKQMSEKTIAVLVQVPGIIPDSVKVDFRDRSVLVRFHAQPLISSSTEVDEGTSSSNIADGERYTTGSSMVANPNNYRRISEYAGMLLLGSSIVPEKSSFDVADKNMAIGMYKRVEGYWSDSEAAPAVYFKPYESLGDETGKDKAEADSNGSAKSDPEMPKTQNDTADHQALLYEKYMRSIKELSLSETSTSVVYELD